MAIETIFKNIADAIREKAGTSGLITPVQMPQAIADIPSGGGGGLITPDAYQLAYGYISSGFFYSSPYKAYCLSFYSVQQGDNVLLALTNNSNVNRNECFIAFFARPFSDFSPYLNTGHSKSQVFTGTSIASYTSIKNNFPATFAIEYTVPSDGIIIFETSSNAALFPCLCVKE